MVRIAKASESGSSAKTMGKLLGLFARSIIMRLRDATTRFSHLDTSAALRRSGLYLFSCYPFLFSRIFLCLCTRLYTRSAWPAFIRFLSLFYNHSQRLTLSFFLGWLYFAFPTLLRRPSLVREAMHLERTLTRLLRALSYRERAFVISLWLTYSISMSL